MNYGQSPEISNPEFSNKIQEDVLYLYQTCNPCGLHPFNLPSVRQKNLHLAN